MAVHRSHGIGIRHRGLAKAGSRDPYTADTHDDQ